MLSKLISHYFGHCLGTKNSAEEETANLQDKFPGYILDSIKDATTDDAFGLKDVVVTSGNKVQELAVSVIKRKADLNTFKFKQQHSGNMEENNNKNTN